jgi:hypothetical protein
MRMHNVLAVFLLIGVLGACNTAAHELRPAYLELRQTTSDTFDVLTHHH